MGKAADDKVDSVIDGYNVPVRRISVLTLPSGLVSCSMLKGGVASKQAVYHHQILSAVGEQLDVYV